MKLHLKNMEVYVNIGLHNWEKIIKRLVILDIEIIKDKSSYNSEKCVSELQVLHKKNVNVVIDSKNGSFDVLNVNYMLSKTCIVDVSSLKKSVMTYCMNKSFDYVENLVLSLRSHLIQELNIVECKIRAEKVQFLMSPCYSCEE